MMLLGFSDATIRILKQGKGSREQGELCRRLGPSVAPVVYDLVEDGYVMELLDQPPARGKYELLSVFARLSHSVWNRPYCSKFEPGGWLELLLKDSLDFPWLGEAISVCYPEEPTAGYTLIHGDPTLANLMVRRSGEKVVSDPMPRMLYRFEIPDRREVDLGKLVQSAAGWEHMLGCPGALYEQEYLILNKLTPHDRRLACLWAAIHLARVARRAPARGEFQIEEWAQSSSKHFSLLALKGFS